MISGRHFNLWINFYSDLRVEKYISINYRYCKLQSNNFPFTVLLPLLFTCLVAWMSNINYIHGESIYYLNVYMYIISSEQRIES